LQCHNTTTAKRFKMEAYSKLLIDMCWITVVFSIFLH